MEIKKYSKEIKEAMVQKQEIEKLQKELTFVLVGDTDGKRKIEEQIAEKNKLLTELREKIQTELETEKETFKSEEELKKLENQLVKGQKVGAQALKKEIEEANKNIKEIMTELKKGDTSRTEELKQETEKLADKTKMLQKYEADMYKFAEYKSIEKNQEWYKEVSGMLSTIKTGKWLEEINDMINPKKDDVQKDDVQKDDTQKDDAQKDDVQKDDTKKKAPKMTEADFENYRNNIYDWVANNTDGLTDEDKNNLKDEKGKKPEDEEPKDKKPEDKNTKGKDDYRWHADLTPEQIDEMWAEGILPGSEEYNKKLGNYGIKIEKPKEKDDYEWHADLTPEQIDELWAEGIVPGSDEYNMKLGNYGIKDELPVKQSKFKRFINAVKDWFIKKFTKKSIIIAAQSVDMEDVGKENEGNGKDEDSSKEKLPYEEIEDPVLRKKAEKSYEILKQIEAGKEVKRYILSADGKEGIMDPKNGKDFILKDDIKEWLEKQEKEPEPTFDDSLKFDLSKSNQNIDKLKVDVNQSRPKGGTDRGRDDD